MDSFNILDDILGNEDDELDFEDNDAKQAHSEVASPRERLEPTDPPNQKTSVQSESAEEPVSKPQESSIPPSSDDNHQRITDGSANDNLNKERDRAFKPERQLDSREARPSTDQSDPRAGVRRAELEKEPSAPRQVRITREPDLWRPQDDDRKGPGSESRRRNEPDSWRPQERERERPRERERDDRIWPRDSENKEREQMRERYSDRRSSNRQEDVTRDRSRIYENFSARDSRALQNGKHREGEVTENLPTQIRDSQLSARRLSGDAQG
ncbi:uncharacterized protein EV422DRAFT_142806 [Fimicolochytrium jonesii]|uniref:uncharacterized protein n=1 Tax=Fimicolochytrium jonesii TaxID=1396493 RepID=UPI0022FEB8E1|nr:uncharacterized protein EV422DRAFT_142806 [Fimicolochytrium jonesii]KAI8825829.1 hypothetical protein EV422DRAFT_142806 [Fimicolochytrium jonesii]